MSWFPILQGAYILLLVFVCLRIIYDTKSNTKALAYLLLVIFVPIAGILFYFSFGINLRKRKLYSKKLTEDAKLSEAMQKKLLQYTKDSIVNVSAELEQNKELILMLVKDNRSPLTSNNAVELLVNGENKFPAVLEAIRNAKHHIHIQYYIYEDDEIGKEVEKALIEKAQEGVIVRFIYDDFGSHAIRRHLIPRLKKAGIKTFPFYRVILWVMANRLNYRNHRKIIVVDGIVGFVGGINVSDRYINGGPKGKKKKKVFWRDTHLRIEGPGVLYLQYLFVCDWNFCAKDNLIPEEIYFPKPGTYPVKGDKIVQIAASGPDSDNPTVLYSMLQAINLANEEILITTPYFIPGDSILDALVVSALGGVRVALLVPETSDSKIANGAARSYYDDLLAAGVEIYLYKKGFVHAKSLVADSKIVIVGSANMDYRSFDLNFEVNAIVYDEDVAKELKKVFNEDVSHSKKIDKEKWKNRSWPKKLVERTARLISPLL